MFSLWQNSLLNISSFSYSYETNFKSLTHIDTQGFRDSSSNDIGGRLKCVSSHFSISKRFMINYLLPVCLFSNVVQHR